ncbi:MAG: peptidoglycan DD-metalloendopeptidase family protein [bacterium]
MLFTDRPRYSPRALAAGGTVFAAFLALLVSLTAREARTSVEGPEAQHASAVAIIARTPEATEEALRNALASAAAPESAAAAAAAAEASAPASAAPATEPLPPFVDHAGTLEKNQTLSGALGQFGVDGAQVNAIVQALGPHFSFRSARPGAHYNLTVRTADMRVEKFRFEHGPLEIYEAFREGDELKGREVPVEVTTRIVGAGGEIQSTLYEAIQASGESSGIAASMIDVFAWDIDFYKDTRPGDRFKVLVEKLYTGDSFIRYGRLLAAEYHSVKKGTFRTFWFQGPGEKVGGYYLEDGQSARKTFLATPLKYVRVSSGFNRHRKHPVLGYTKAHMGTDFAAPTGTPVWAMADGKVTWAGMKGANGNLVVIQHAGGLTSLYAHLHRIKVKRGQTVEQKQIVGTVGTTGRSTGPHLHFGVKVNGKYVNPQNLKMTRGEGIARKLRPAFEAMRAEKTKQLEAITIGAAPPVVALVPTTVVVPLPDEEPEWDAGPPDP